MSAHLPFVVCFEVEPTVQGFDRYLAIAKDLRPALDHIPGFESIERSRSRNHDTRLLSLSYWADEAAIVAWRSHGAHHEAQIIGRNELFVDYRLRIGQVVRRWTPQNVTTSERSGPGASWLGIMRIDDNGAPHDRFPGFERYESMVNPGRAFLVGGLANEDSSRSIEAELTASSGARMVFDTCRVLRDYGRFERTEAPQHFPSIARP